MRDSKRNGAAFVVAAILALTPALASDGMQAPEDFQPFTGRVGAPDKMGGYRSDAVLLRLAAGRAVDAAGLPGVAALSLALDHRPQNLALAERHGLTRLYTATLHPGVDARQAVTDLSATPGVERAELIGIGGVLATIPDDTDFALQYGLLNTGQTIAGVAGTPGADINASQAWDLTTGDPDVKIAIVDTGVSQSHPDLQTNVLPGYSPLGASWDDDIFISHGTHCAGIASGDSDNAMGIAGVGWDCSILPVKVLGFLGSGTEPDIAAGVVWAADNGADVISMSLGSPDFGAVLENACNYAADLNVIVVAATGNTPGVPIFAPARYDSTIAVGATNNRDQIADFTTTGPEMTVTAPGVDVWSTWDTLDLFGPTDGYTFQSGTSMATPHVAGLAGLMRSVDRDIDPLEVRAILEATSVDLGAPGFDPVFGHGRIDAHAAVLGAIGAGCPADFDGDGELTLFDFLAFQNAFDAGDPAADFDGDGSLTLFDFLSFQNAFDAGC
ncbi:MAG: S8 family serine peptidase [Phycisphaerales bacterium JB060]